MDGAAFIDRDPTLFAQVLTGLYPTETTHPPHHTGCCWYGRFLGRQSVIGDGMLRFQMLWEGGGGVWLVSGAGERCIPCPEGLRRRYRDESPYPWESPSVHRELRFYNLPVPSVSVFDILQNATSRRRMERGEIYTAGGDNCARLRTTHLDWPTTHRRCVNDAPPPPAAVHRRLDLRVIEDGGYGLVFALEDPADSAVHGLFQTRLHRKPFDVAAIPVRCLGGLGRLQRLLSGIR